MRAFKDGNGNDSSQAVLDHLAANYHLHQADLFVINTAPQYAGQYLDKQFLLTNYGKPLTWSVYGQFKPASITRAGVSSKIGLKSATLDVTWSPKDTDILAQDGSPLATTLTALQGFKFGIFDNGTVEVWRCVMPNPGDADTFGACLLYSGRIGNIKPDRLNVTMSVIDRRETLNIQVPTNLIEPTNIYAQYAVGAIPTGGPAQLGAVSGSTTSKIYADDTASPAVLMPENTYNAGYLVFTSGKLAGTYRRIQTQRVESSHHAFYLNDPLPFAPAVSDTLVAYVPVPLDQVSAVAIGSGVAMFPYVPSPVNSSVVIA